MLYLYRSVLRYLANSKKVFIVFIIALLFELSFEYFTSLSIKYLIDDAITPRNMTIFFGLLLALLIGGVLNLLIGVGGEHAMMQTFSTLILASLSMVVGTAILFVLEWKLAIVAFVGIVFMFVPQKLLNKRAQRYNEEYVGIVESFSNNMDEEMKAFKVIRGFQLQESMKNRFTKQLQVWFRLGVKRSFINSNLERLPIMVLSVVNVIILGLGGYFTFQGSMTIGDLIAFYSVFDTVGVSVIQFMEVVPDLIEGEVGVAPTAHAFL
ncbi:hypothetical protein PAECIP111891_05639 [Paenibacillus allorhizoplanae]|uniref:ABC transmembrane type-1 domain-containing protein n=1 Tax=Paenibacillus allorhizoplanae TaxID=2905648 RepID=A0ABN8H5E5_9BACL|nr:ABC transporter ATP-binding protein [Paenibacillus allorhizoplanae]CAH1224138.1 hypothetical protein PAECIP111891_05639 [Paenibacillus allorhizoplanae]